MTINQNRLLLLALLSVSLCGCGTLRKSPAISAVEPVPTIQRVSMARLQERQGDTRTAQRIYEQVLATNPDQSLARHRMGVLEARAGHYDVAIAHFEAARQAGKSDPELMNDLGYACYLKGDLPAAERWLREALTSDSRNRQAHNNLGLVLGAMGRDRESLDQFRLAGSMADAWNNVAWVQAQRGDTDAAQRSYLKALDADASIKPAAEALVAIEQRREALVRIARRTDPDRRPRDTVKVVSYEEALPTALPEPGALGVTLADFEASGDDNRPREPARLPDSAGAAVALDSATREHQSELRPLVAQPATADPLTPRTNNGVTASPSIEPAATLQTAAAEAARLPAVSPRDADRDALADAPEPQAWNQLFLPTRALSNPPVPAVPVPAAREAELTPPLRSDWESTTPERPSAARRPPSIEPQFHDWPAFRPADSRQP